MLARHHGFTAEELDLIVNYGTRLPQGVASGLRSEAAGELTVGRIDFGEDV